MQEDSPQDAQAQTGPRQYRYWWPDLKLSEAEAKYLKSVSIAEIEKQVQRLPPCGKRSKETAISVSNANAVMRACRLLFAGEGVVYKPKSGGLPFAFAVGTKITLASDLAGMQKHVAEHFPAKGGANGLDPTKQACDAGNGWLLHHPLGKLQLIKEHFLAKMAAQALLARQADPPRPTANDSPLRISLIDSSSDEDADAAPAEPAEPELDTPSESNDPSDSIGSSAESNQDGERDDASEECIGNRAETLRERVRRAAMHEGESVYELVAYDVDVEDGGRWARFRGRMIDGNLHCRIEDPSTLHPLRAPHADYDENMDMDNMFVNDSGDILTLDGEEPTTVIGRFLGGAGYNAIFYDGVQLQESISRYSGYEMFLGFQEDRVAAAIRRWRRLRCVARRAGRIAHFVRQLYRHKPPPSNQGNKRERDDVNEECVAKARKLGLQEAITAYHDGLLKARHKLNESIERRLEELKREEAEKRRAAEAKMGVTTLNKQEAAAGKDDVTHVRERTTVRQLELRVAYPWLKKNPEKMSPRDHDKGPFEFDAKQVNYQGLSARIDAFRLRENNVDIVEIKVNINQQTLKTAIGELLAAEFAIKENSSSGCKINKRLVVPDALCHGHMKFAAANGIEVIVPDGLRQALNDHFTNESDYFGDGW